MSETPTAAQPQSRCIGCGYDIFGLPPSARCPECGTPLEESLRGDLLQFRHPAYLVKLRRGAFFVESAINLIVGSIAISFVLVILVASMRGPDWLFAGGMTIIALAILTGMILFPIGWWFLSTPDPGVSDDASGQRARRLIRITVVVTVITSLLTTAQSIFFSGALGASTLGELMRAVSTGLKLTCVVAWVVQFYAAMIYVRWLAKLIPSPRIHKRAGLLMWLGPLLCLLYCLFFPILIAAVLYANLMSRVKRALTQIIAQPEQSPLT